jgi:hypothetical protein
MSISDFYASTIIKVEASFGFDHFECSPDDITLVLGIQPDEVRRKGDARILRNGREFLIPFSSWGISSSVMSKDVNDHLRQLLERIAPAAYHIRDEWGEPNFGVLWKGNYLYAGSGPFYEPDVIRGIARLGASLYQDIYQIDQDDDEVDNQSDLTRIPK